MRWNLEILFLSAWSEIPKKRNKASNFEVAIIRLKFNDVCVGAKNWPGDEFFRLGKSKFSECQFFSIGNI